LSKVAEVMQIAVYSQVEAMDPQSSVTEASGGDEVDYVTLTSSNIARAFIQSLDEPTRKLFEIGKIKIVTISPVTSATVRELGLPVAAEATRFTTEGIIEALIKMGR